MRLRIEERCRFETEKRFSEKRGYKPKLKEKGEDDTEAQSGMRRPKVAVPKGNQATHPADDVGATIGNMATSVVDAVTSIPATIIDGAVGTLGSVIDAGASALLGALLDKPDQVDEQQAVIIEQSKDLFAADIPDTNVCFSLNKGRYVDPSPDRMPMSKNWTLLDYAKIPGYRLKQVFTTATGFNKYEFPLILDTTTYDGLRTPLDYACQCAYLKRGSVKVMFQFFTSSFVSARFAVQLMRYDSDITLFDPDYAYGLSKVINVNGDSGLYHFPMVGPCLVV